MQYSTPNIMEYDFNKYVGKKILIIGGGTSTLDVRWEKLDVDYIWTCNEFYLEPRVLNANIDLYLLSYTTDITNKDLINKLKNSDTQVFYEGIHYRGKEHTKPFKNFNEEINIPIYSMEFYQVSKHESPAAFSGAMFRMICTALHFNPKQVYFTGFDGFNEKFTNIHAFTKHRGLKATDTRRAFDGRRDSYKSVFEAAYKQFLRFPNYNVLQNLGEGYEYNIGTPISQQYFKLNEKTLEALGKSPR